MKYGRKIIINLIIQIVFLVASKNHFVDFTEFLLNLKKLEIVRIGEKLIASDIFG